MTELFADTFYWLAVLNPDDNYHERALGVSLSGRLVTSWAVLLEVMDACCAQRLRPLAVRFLAEINADPDLVVISLDDDLLRRATALFAIHRDKDWSLTDCTSFVIMRQRNIMSALTGDHHFQQAGFLPLIR